MGKGEEIELKPSFFACEELEVDRADIISGSRAPDICSARKVVYCFLRLIGWSYNRIGQSLGKSHQAVANGVRTATKLELLASTYILTNWKETIGEKNENDRDKRRS